MFKFLIMFCIVATLGAIGVWKYVPLLKTKFYEQMYGEQVAKDNDPLFMSSSENQMRDNENVLTPKASSLFDIELQKLKRQEDSSALASSTSLPSRWGILKESVKGFTATGEVGGKIPGATIIEQVSRHDSDHGVMIKSRVLRQKDQQWIEDIFIPESALVIFNKSYDETPQEDRDLVVKSFTLKAKIADRKSMFKEAAIKANPHFTAYQTAVKAVLELQKKGKELVAQRDAAVGLKRNTFNDQLRKLKSDEAILLKQLSEVEVLYKKWRDSNDDGSVAAKNDAQIKSWTAELQRVEPEARFRMGGDWQ